MDIGPHLLGAKPSPEDSRDFRALSYLQPAGSIPASKRWVNKEKVLDQGTTPHCVGFGGAQFSNVLPVDLHEVNADGHKLYYECKVFDGEPGEENGSDSRSLARALIARRRISVYSYAADLSEVALWVLTRGPVIVCSVWTNSMFTPSKTGAVKPTGGVAGGHCWLITGYSTSANRFRCLNSWSDEWGAGGFFTITKPYLQVLANEWAEFLCTDELP